MRTFLWLVPLVLAACATDTKGGDDAVDSGGPDAAELRAADLWPDLEGYADWAQHEDWTGVVASEDGSHGPHVSIWMNQLAADAIAAADGGAMPEGAILVKEGYSDAEGTDSNGITVMLKEADWGDDGWFWAKYKAGTDGEVALAGSPTACTGCHSTGQDSVRFVSW